MKGPIRAICAGMCLFWGCQQSNHTDFSPGTFGYDVQRVPDALVLEKGDAQVLLSSKYQGRVMTSTAAGRNGQSFGWLNYELLESGEFLPHITPIGGEDRFWLGPEGGQFSIFFPKGAAFTLEDWQTPPAIDSEPFELVSSTATEALYTQDIQLRNYSGTEFSLNVNRAIRLQDDKEVQDELNIEIPEDVQYVAFESENTIRNTGSHSWSQESGALSIWILGMLKPSPKTTIVIPFVTGSKEELGPIVNDAYFGKVPTSNLVIGDGVIFFKGDGQLRSKIGLSPQRTQAISGSYDGENQVLTLVRYTVHPGTLDYVNSMWEIQEEPFRGDVVNSYNDGPVGDGSQLGPFYELESSSRAAFLAPGEEMIHVHSTYHFQGELSGLSAIATKVWGLSIEEIEQVFNE